jgi:LysM repeat protein
MHSRLKGLLAAAGIAAVLAVGPAMTREAAASDTVVVRSGDTLSKIAAAHGMTVAQLASLNRINDPNRIYAGQTLRLKPTAAGPAAAKATPSTQRTHVVLYGETLTGIARRYATTIQAIVALNHLRDASRIFAGQHLVVAAAAPVAPPAAKASSKPAPAPATRTHRVRPGETLTAIARRYGTTIQAIVKVNTIRNPSFVRTGTVLRIPGGGVPPAATTSPSMPASMRALVSKRSAIRTVIVEEARRFGVPVSFALAVAWQESGWQQGLTSYAGAIGVMQLLPATGDWVSGMLGFRVNLRDTRHNVRAGVRLLRHYLDRYHGDRSLVLAAYYQGQTATDRHGVYPVSRPYIASILFLERLFR